jgi:hypothetical protein
VAGFFDSDGTPVVNDMFVGGYTRPSVDKSQDISDASLTRADGVNTLKFKKMMKTGDDDVRY